MTEREMFCSAQHAADFAGEVAALREGTASFVLLRRTVKHVRAA